MRKMSTRLNTNLDLKQISEISKKMFEKLKTDTEYLQKTGIVIGMAVILLVGTSFLNSYLKGNISIATSKQKEYQEITEFMNEYNKTYKNYQQDANKVQSKILSKSDVDKGILLINKLAQSHNIQITNSKKADKTKKLSNGISTQQMDLNIEGTYPNIIKFVQELENLNFFVSTEAFDVGKGRVSGVNTDTISAKLTYNIFCTDDAVENVPKK